MTPDRIKEAAIKYENKYGKEMPVLIATEKGGSKDLSSEDADDIKEGCNKFSDETFLPNLFDKYCEHLKNNFANKFNLDLKKLEEVQAELKANMENRPMAEKLETDPYRYLDENGNQKYREGIGLKNNIGETLSKHRDNIIQEKGYSVHDEYEKKTEQKKEISGPKYVFRPKFEETKEPIDYTQCKFRPKFDSNEEFDTVDEYIEYQTQNENDNQTNDINEKNIKISGIITSLKIAKEKDSK